MYLYYWTHIRDFAGKFVLFPGFFSFFLSPFLPPLLQGSEKGPPPSKKKKKNRLSLKINHLPHPRRLPSLDVLGIEPRTFPMLRENHTTRPHALCCLRTIPCLQRYICTHTNQCHLTGTNLYLLCIHVDASPEQRKKTKKKKKLKQGEIN